MRHFAIEIRTANDRLDAIGCRWGYAPAGEMEEHGAYEIIEKPEQIKEAVNRYFQTH